MNLCYQVATPDVAIADSVTAFQGPIENSFSTLAELGYSGVELMTLNPHDLDWDFVKNTAYKNNLKVALVCTGELFGQLSLSYTDVDDSVRKEAIKRTFEVIDFAEYLEAKINIGRIRGQYCNSMSHLQTEEYAVEAFKRISDYAGPKGVSIALESVTIMQTNFINTVEEAARFVDMVNYPNFKLMMDIFHLNIEEKDILETIEKYNSYNIHVHLADNNRRYPGQCGLNFSEILKKFKDVGYMGDFCTEIYQTPSQEVAVQKSAEYLLPILAEVYCGKVNKFV